MGENVEKGERASETTHEHEPLADWLDLYPSRSYAEPMKHTHKVYWIKITDFTFRMAVLLPVDNNLLDMQEKVEVLLSLLKSVIPLPRWPLIMHSSLTIYCGRFLLLMVKLQENRTTYFNLESRHIFCPVYLLRIFHNMDQSSN